MKVRVRMLMLLEFYSQFSLTIPHELNGLKLDVWVIVVFCDFLYGFRNRIVMCKRPERFNCLDPDSGRFVISQCIHKCGLNVLVLVGKWLQGLQGFEPN